MEKFDHSLVKLRVTRGGEADWWGVGSWGSLPTAKGSGTPVGRERERGRGRPVGCEEGWGGGGTLGRRGHGGGARGTRGVQPETTGASSPPHPAGGATAPCDGGDWDRSLLPPFPKEILILGRSQDLLGKCDLGNGFPLLQMGGNLHDHNSFGEKVRGGKNRKNSEKRKITFAKSSWFFPSCRRKTPEKRMKSLYKK